MNPTLDFRLIFNFALCILHLPLAFRAQTEKLERMAGDLEIFLLLDMFFLLVQIIMEFDILDLFAIKTDQMMMMVVPHQFIAFFIFAQQNTFNDILALQKLDLAIHGCFVYVQPLFFKRLHKIGNTERFGKAGQEIDNTFPYPGDTMAGLTKRSQKRLGKRIHRDTNSINATKLHISKIRNLVASVNIFINLEKIFRLLIRTVLAYNKMNYIV